ncbi:hypothetical protein, partial [Arthrobacter sp. 260]|uniref:hypothetical protein n=1 Tax=Arthrobacter sp. 260 TaxID=2735314 RepID=UPI00149182CB
MLRVELRRFGVTDADMKFINSQPDASTRSLIKIRKYFESKADNRLSLEQIDQMLEVIRSVNNELD